MEDPSAQCAEGLVVCTICPRFNYGSLFECLNKNLYLQNIVFVLMSSRTKPTKGGNRFGIEKGPLRTGRGERKRR